jgi:hypothetical protein
VEGFGAATVAVPLGAREPRPVVLALHGNYDRPEWQCEVWRGIVGPRPWVLCPRGVPRGDAPKGADRWTFTTAQRLTDEVAAALLALGRAYPEHSDTTQPVLTGFSLGAILGVQLLAAKTEAARYRAAVLVEGGYEGWHRARAKGFVAQGGRRILFACGQSACQHASKQAVRVLGTLEIESDVVFGGNIGHTYDGSVAESIRSRWSWLVELDERFGEPRTGE